jgi:predicted RNase H-like HicB family nuclease
MRGIGLGEALLMYAIGVDLMKYVYPACFYPEDNGQFSVIFPDLGGIATYGNDLGDAVDMASDLLCTWILECKKDKEQIPSPSDICDVKPDGKGAFVNLIVADISAYTHRNSKSVKKTLTIPAWLNDIAEKENLNFSQILQSALKERLRIEV